MAGVHWRSVGVRHCMRQHAYPLSIVDHTNGGHYCLPLAHPSPLLYCVLQLINRRLASYLVTQLLDLEKIFILSNRRQQPVAESHPLLSRICICSFGCLAALGRESAAQKTSTPSPSYTPQLDLACIFHALLFSLSHFLYGSFVILMPIPSDS